MQKRLIVSNPKIMMSKPVIAGTRVTVEMILEKLSAGETVEDILEAHPRLTREAIRAALAFAAEALRADVIYPVVEVEPEEDELEAIREGEIEYKAGKYVDWRA